MNASFDKTHDTMSLYLTYDAAKPTDCDEAARLVEAFTKTAEKSNSGAFGAFAPLALFGMAANMPKGKRTQGTVTDGIQTAIKATNGETPYDRGFRNALRYAQWLVDGTVPQYEGPTWGNEGGNDTAAAEVTPLQAAIKAAASEMAKQLSDLAKNAYKKPTTAADDTVKEAADNTNQ